MLIGEPLAFDPGWSLVEGDLYDVSRRVREYDEDARLVRDGETGVLGLGRFLRYTDLTPHGTVVLAARCLDPRTREPLTGEPDPRVLSFQRIADGHRIGNLTVWARHRRDGIAAARAREKAAQAEWSRHMAHEYVWRRNRVDLGRRPSAVVSRSIG